MSVQHDYDRAPEAAYSTAILALLDHLTGQQLVELLFDWPRFESRLKAHLLQRLAEESPKAFARWERTLWRLAEGDQESRGD